MIENKIKKAQINIKCPNCEMKTLKILKTNGFSLVCGCCGWKSGEKDRISFSKFLKKMERFEKVRIV
jgi:biotin synthase-like enzyme